MSPEVQREYSEILTQVALRNGALMASPGDRQYGWIDSQYAHLATCGVKSYGRAVEREFSQFEGTFAPETRIRLAIDVDNVSCNCGQIVGREVRWEPCSGLQDVAQAVFAELYEKLRVGDEK